MNSIKPKSSKDKYQFKIWRSVTVFVVVLLVMSAVVLWNWYILKQNEEQDSRKRFDLDVISIEQSLRERMHAYEMVLRGLASAFVNNPDQISYKDWQNIIAQLHVYDLYPGISSLVWSRYFAHGQLDEFIKRNQTDNRFNFHIFPSGERDFYHVIQYIGPLNDSTERVVGLDILTQYPQNQTRQSAVELGTAVLSVPLSLYTGADGEELIGALMYFPVYPNSQIPVNLAERESKLMGIANAAFRGQELVEGIFGEQLRLFHIIAHDSEYPKMAIFDSKTNRNYVTPPNWKPKFSTQIKIFFYGRTWLLNIIGTPEFEKGLAFGNKHNLSLFLGVCLAFLMAFSAALFIYQRDRKMYASQKLAIKLHEQAQELMLANRYKSEFLANMSHELRTPLNSILILSDQLRQNTAGNLSKKQAEHADIVYKAGNDLLQLINDVLDLAKIEAGRIQINLEQVNLHNLLMDLDAAMRPQAEAKNLQLIITAIDGNSDLPTQIKTDRIRLHQILRNLLSNAIKFTDTGEVKLDVRLGKSHPDERTTLIFAVQDSGIGIESKYHHKIFEAFAQIDGSTRRRFGGTGLGLPITKQLAQALEGTITLSSKLGQGSTFTVQIPVEIVDNSNLEPINSIKRSGVGPSLLIIEDDPSFAEIIITEATTNGFAIVHCSNGKQALELLAKEHFVAVIIDILLPDISGWQLFQHLRDNPAYQSTPIQIISCLPEPVNFAGQQSTYYLTKPVSHEALEQVFANLHLISHPINDASLLLIEDVDHERQHYRTHLESLGFKVTDASNAGCAKKAWQATEFDVLVIDLNLPDEDGFSLLKNLDVIRSLHKTHIVINTGLDVNFEGLQQLQNYSAVVVHKHGDDTSSLSKAVQGFLRDLEQVKSLAQTNLAVTPIPSNSTNILQGKHILLVDDDIRNVYAMSALLDNFGLELSSASNGEEAITSYLKGGLDLILMDMAMPVMDGYTAMTLLKNEHNCDIPIIALTAHAMKGDREKCLAAGADDYMTKPVQSANLQALLERWLLKQL